MDTTWLTAVGSIASICALALGVVVALHLEFELRRLTGKSA